MALIFVLNETTLNAIFFYTYRFQLLNPCEMNNSATKNPASPLMKAVKNFFSKLVKTNDEFPVKYYKRDKHPARGKATGVNH